MNNNKICTYCNALNQNDSKFCRNCGAQLIQNNIQQNTNNIVEEKNENNNNNSNGTKLGIISLLAYFICPVIVATIFNFLPVNVREKFSTLGGLCPLIGIIIMIVGRVKYPNNKLLKVVMWVIIISILLGIVMFIFISIWFYITCSNFSKGCSS